MDGCEMTDDRLGLACVFCFVSSRDAPTLAITTTELKTLRIVRPSQVEIT